MEKKPIRQMRQESPPSKKPNKISKSNAIFFNDDDDLKDLFSDYLQKVGELDEQ